MATAHGQLHMTGNCITLSSFCECQGEARGKRKGEGGIALAAATKCAHSAHHKGVRVRERGRWRETKSPLLFRLLFALFFVSCSPLLLLEIALAPCCCSCCCCCSCFFCCCKWQIRQCCCIPFAPRPFTSLQSSHSHSRALSL